MIETATWYCTYPAERTWTPNESDVLPKVETCNHPECFIPDTVELEALPVGGGESGGA